MITEPMPINAVPKILNLYAINIKPIAPINAPAKRIENGVTQIFAFLFMLFDKNDFLFLYFCFR